MDVGLLSDHFTRIKNQEALMLSKLPAYEYDHSTLLYNVIDIVKEIYEIRTSLIFDCKEVANLTLDYIYPKSDKMYQYTEEMKCERINMIQKQKVPDNGSDCYLSVIDWC